MFAFRGCRTDLLVLPGIVVEPLRTHLLSVQDLHQVDLHKGYGRVYLPNALSRKYLNAEREWIWQYIFPSKMIAENREDGMMRRHHILPSYNFYY